MGHAADLHIKPRQGRRNALLGESPHTQHMAGLQTFYGVP
jgi:hypothetical protein